MRWITRSFLAAGIAVAGATAAFSAALQTPNSPVVAVSPSLDTIAGKKLISIDGSAIVLTPLEGSLTRETIAANGAVRGTSFHFITEQLGTVADLRDPNKPLGVFRMDKRQVDIKYADGGSEAMFVNAEGALLVETKAPEAAALCTAWYPEGHVFSMEERKAAVAQYASRLGLADNGNKEAATRKAEPGCGIRDDLAAIAAEKKPLASASGGENVLSVGLGVAPLAAPSASSSGIASALASRPDVIARTAAIPGAVPVLPQPGSRATADQGAQGQSSRGGTLRETEGASRCLSLESERGYRGFRNYCAYPVQFAYCVIGRTLEPASCQYGAAHGSTEAWGFSAIDDRPLSAANAPMGLRWIACRGRASDVLPRLEQIDPPSGHCVSLAR